MRRGIEQFPNTDVQDEYGEPPEGYDLAPCPICGSECYSDGVSVACKARHSKSDARSCVYMLDDDCAAPGWSHEAADARLSDAHNRLYRRAEIGRLVESILASGFDLRLSGVSPGLPTFYARAHNRKEFHTTGAATLFEALRALAAEAEVAK